MKSLGKSILKGSLVMIGIACLSLLYAYLAFILRAEAVIEISTGKDGTFEPSKPTRLILVDTNTGPGSSPGMINPDRVRLFDPNGELCESTPILPPPLRSKGGFKALPPKANSCQVTLASEACS